MAKILSIIAPINFQDKEYNDSKVALERAGHTVITASTSQIAHGSFGAEVKIDLLLSDVNVDDYDAVLFVGGSGCFDYFENKIALNLAKTFYNSRKLTTAICAAPSILANAGILNGKNVTCWEGESDNIKKYANYTGEDVTKDDQIITANGPMAATAFGESIAKAL